MNVKVKMLICQMSLIVGIVWQGPKKEGKGPYRGLVGKNRGASCDGTKILVLCESTSAGKVFY